MRKKRQTAAEEMARMIAPEILSYNVQRASAIDPDCVLPVLVIGNNREEILDYLELPDNNKPPFHPVTESKEEAKIVIRQVSEPYRQCSHYAGDFTEVSIEWWVDVKLSTPEGEAEGICAVHEKKDVHDVNFWECLSDELAEHMREQGIRGASMNELELESERLGWNRIITKKYGAHGFTKKMRRAVCSKAKRKIRERVVPHGTSSPIEVSEGWLGLRELANALCIERELSLRDSTIISHYMVPEEAGETKVELRKRLLEGELKNLRIKQPAFNAVIRSKVSKKGSVITNTDLGRLGEQFTHRLLIPSIECHVGPQSSGTCDISDKESGDPATACWALNAKVSLEDEVNRSFEVSPEHQVSRSWVLLIMPRLLMMRLYPITGEHMTINSASGGLCVTPEELAQRLKEMIDS